jgi:hypothetical protein
VKEPVWINERDAIALHDRLLALHGGLTGCGKSAKFGKEKLAA